MIYPKGTKFKSPSGVYEIAEVLTEEKLSKFNKLSGTGYRLKGSSVIIPFDEMDLNVGNRVWKIISEFAEGGTTNYGVDELYDIATRTFIGLGYDVTQGSNSKTDYGHSRYFYVNQDNKADVNSGLGFQVRVSDHSTGDRRILNGEQFIFDNKDVMEVFNRINYWFHPEEYKNVVVVKTKVVQIEVGENDLQPSDSIISERVAKSGSKRYTIKRTYKNEGVVPTHKFSGHKLPFKPNNPDIRFAEGGETKRYMKKYNNGGNADTFDLSSILSEFGLDDIIADIEKKSSSTKGKKITRKTKEDKKIFGDFIFADNDPNTLNYTLRNITEKFIIEQGSKEANTPEETRLLSLLKSWVDSIAEADAIAESKPLLEKLRDQYPQYFAPSNPSGTLMFRGLSKVQSYALDELRKMKISDFILYKENDGTYYVDDARTKFVLLKKPIVYVPSKEIQSWTPVLKSAQGFYREGMLVTKQDDDFFINEDTLEKIYGSDENENIHIGKEFKNNVYLSLRYDYFVRDVLPYLIEDMSSNETFIEASEKLKFADGGNTTKRMKKIKRGGITYGKSHAEGGIPVKNESTGDMLEVEGGEGIVNKRSMASDKKVKLNGKEMTICEAVSQLNQLEGGVQFSCDDVSDRQFIEAMAKGGELERGTRTEKEHIQVLKDLYAKRITPKEASKRIAKDHLKEDSRYYSKLDKMEGKMEHGGLMLDKESRDLLSEIYAKYADGGEIDSDDEKINMQDYEGYIDVYNERKKAFQGSSEKFQKLLEEGIEVKNDPNLSDEEKNKQLDEIRKKAKEAKAVRVADRDNFVDMRNIDSPFYAPQLADGGLLKDIPKGTRFSKELKPYVSNKKSISENDYFDFKVKPSERYPSIAKKGYDVSVRALIATPPSPWANEQFIEIHFYIGSKSVDFSSYPMGYELDRLLKNIGYENVDCRIHNVQKSKSVQLLILKPFDQITFGEIYNISSLVIEAMSNKKSWDKYTSEKPFEQTQSTTSTAQTPATTSSAPSNFLIRFKTEKESFGNSSFIDSMWWIYGKPIDGKLPESQKFMSDISQGGNVVVDLKSLGVYPSDPIRKTEYVFNVNDITSFPFPTDEIPSDWNWRFKTSVERYKPWSEGLKYVEGKKISFSKDSQDWVKVVMNGLTKNTDTRAFGIVAPNNNSDSIVNNYQNQWLFDSRDITNDPLPQSSVSRPKNETEIYEEARHWCIELDDEINANNQVINADEVVLMSDLIYYLALNKTGMTNADFEEMTDLGKKHQFIHSKSKELQEENLGVGNSVVMEILLDKFIKNIEQTEEFFKTKTDNETYKTFEVARTQLSNSILMNYLAKFDTFDRDYIQNIN